MRNMDQQKGFTLIELLVVIAIIGMLSSIVLASLNTARSRARDTDRVAGLTALRTAVESYYAEHGTYPPSCGGLNSWGGDMYGSPYCPNDYVDGIVPTYISKLPQRPGTFGTYIYRSSGSEYKILISGIENFNASSTLKDPGYSGCANQRTNTYAVYSGAPDAGNVV